MVVRFCIPTEATCDPAERNMILVDGGSDIVGVEVLLEKGTFLVSNRIPSNPGNGRVWECPLDITTTMDIYSCELFAYRPDGSDWDPYQIHADVEKGVVVNALERDAASLSELSVAIDSAKKSTLVISVKPRDKFENSLISPTEPFAVHVDGLPGGASSYDLTHPSYAVSLDVPQSHSGTILLSFSYDDEFVVGGLEIPVEDESLPVLEIGLGAGAGLVVIALSFFLYVRRQEKIIEAARRLLKLQTDIASKEGEEKVEIQRRATELRKEKAALGDEVLKLEDSLRKKKHDEAELQVMSKAMSEMTESRKSELAEVLINSSDVAVEQLLGKGGFGVVNLGTYRGRKIAIKQLITINSESVARFRFECFLMKGLRHPHIVELVGVCWDADM
ncbi:hypothetical protein TeGR_g11334 [Tetraparma gracilis]|uniref:Protein kinase domain-containing protein n=1 Tax=Tetraparma gracilis TaxID=2962635 RepID=A0ABQ6NE78_9STRA|nr:hypothetical protein TeGR_g11334 [Tetraparma gracilis]